MQSNSFGIDLHRWPDTYVLNIQERFYQVHGDFGYTLKEIGDFLGVHYATVSRAVKRVEMRLSGSKTCPRLSKM